MIVVASLLEKMPNFGHLARTSEVFSLEALVINNKNILDNENFKSVSMNGEKWLPIYEVREKDLIKYLVLQKNLGY